MNDIVIYELLFTCLCPGYEISELFGPRALLGFVSRDVLSLNIWCMFLDASAFIFLVVFVAEYDVFDLLVVSLGLSSLGCMGFHVQGVRFLSTLKDYIQRCVYCQLVFIVFYQRL